MWTEHTYNTYSIVQKPHEYSTKEDKIIHEPINTTYITPLTLQILNILRLLPYQRGIYKDRGFEGFG